MISFDFNIVFTLINLVVFFLLIRFALFKPIKKVLDKREKLIQSQFDEAEEAQKEADKAKADYEEKLKGAEAEKREIIAAAEATAEAEHAEIIEKAEKEAQEMKDTAEAEIEAKREKVKRETRKEIATFALETAEKVIGDSVTRQTDKEIYDKFLNESGEDNEQQN